MQPAVVFRILGLLLLVFSITMLPPALVGVIYQDHTVRPFIEGFVILMLLGLVLWYPLRRARQEMKLRDGFVVVVMFWAGLGMAGAVPLMLADRPSLPFADALFESISALTTTGGTVLVGLDELPKSILFYRQQLQWLGGMGIIVLAVAMLPMLGVGGMQLYRAETPGPVKDSKLTPRIAQTAKALWYVYLLLTAACMGAYWLAGMDGFDALAHAFSTVATGGFSTHDASLGHFDSVSIETVSIVFMALSGVNFALYYFALRHGDLKTWFRDAEFRTYLLLLVGASVVTSGYLYLANIVPDAWQALRLGAFHTVSIATTTGFVTTDFSVWPTFVAVSLIYLSFIGGCASSTGGGMKVIRVMLLFKQGQRELLRLIHPHASLAVKVGDKVLPDRVVEAVWGFFSAYVLVFLIFMLILLATGMDQVTAFSAVAVNINNTGPGLGAVAVNYADISAVQKLVLSLAMLMGRLEIFTLLVLLTPAFWRR